MSHKDKIERESAIVEDINPGKNNDRSMNQDNNNSQSFIESYDEQKSVQSVIEPSEVSKTA
ncbi:MAG: hypothetical protein AB7U98_02105 [Candidatus Nitrosocosmicus sp.]|jgi:hypothetical protein|nr:hypothetical protein [Candidatus Nitrosocosmicus sp.]